MALTEQRRSQLDGIVQKMLQNKESDSNIQFVVDDFKKKYEGESIQSTPAPQTEQPGMLKSIGQGISDFTIGVGKGALSTVKGMANIGEKGLNAIDNLTGQHGLSQMAGLKLGETATDKIIPENLIEAQGTMQSIGKGVEQLGEFLIPGGAAGKIGKSVTAAADVGKAVRAASEIGQIPKLPRLAGFASKLISEGLIGAGQQSVQQGSTDNFLSNAMIFGSLGAAGEALGKAGTYLTKDLPARLVDSALKPSVKELEKGLKFGEDTLGKQVVQKGMIGTDKSLYKKAMMNISANENELQKILTDSAEKVSKGDFYKYLEPQINKLAKTPGMENDFNHVVEVFSQLPKEMTLSEANVIKRNLYNALNDKAFLLDPNLSSKKETMKALAKGIKTEIEKKTAGTAGEGVVKKINQELAMNGKIADRTLNNLAKEEKKRILPSVLGSIGSAGVGAGIGYKTDGVGGALKGAALGVVGEGLLGSTLGKTLGANILKNTSKIPIKTVGKLIKPEIVKKINEK